MTKKEQDRRGEPMRPRMGKSRKATWGVTLGLILAVLIIVIVATMYFSQFFAPILKKTGFLAEEFKEPEHPVTDFPVEQYQDLLRETLGEEFSFAIQFTLDVDVDGTLTNQDYTVINEYITLRKEDMGEKKITLTSIMTGSGVEQVDEIEGIKGLAIFFNKRGLEKPELTAVQEPELRTKYILTIPETTPDGKLKMDIDGDTLRQEVATLEIKKIEGQTLTYTLTPYAEAGYFVS